MFYGLLLAAPIASAQEIVHIYPAPGDSVYLQDLRSRGFEWQAPEGAQKFRLYISGGDIPPNFPGVDVESTTHKQIFEQYPFWFKEGETYTWTIAVLDASGNPILFSDGAVFEIISDASMIPTPTPVIQPTPSGDIDGSAFVDSRDMFILSSFWMKTDGSLPAGDLNQDSIINQNDLLVFQERFGKPGDPPAASPLVGEPQNLTFYPDDQITLQEIQTFEIRWDSPLYPKSDNFLYDILIHPPYGSDIKFNGISANSIRPFNYETRMNLPFTVYIRARLDGVGNSNIVSGQFTIVYSKPSTTTPTPVPQTADLSGDNAIDPLDAVIFMQTYNNYKNHIDFNTFADLRTDERIDRNDLLLFQSYYAQRKRNLAPPAWLSADIPVI
ncbi:MAG: hypothetical protein ACP5I1_18895, partial [Candidatus Hinthialibacter sp.]